MPNNRNPIGAHLSITKGFDGAYKEAAEIGADAMQIFCKSPMQTRLKKVSKEEGLIATSAKNNCKVKYAVIHASYLVNLAKPLSHSSYEFKTIIEDLENADLLGCDGVVVHMGKFTKLDKEVAVNHFVKNVTDIVKNSSGLEAKLILENTAGQGTELGYNFEEFGRIYSSIKKSLGKDKSRLAMCLDTAHAFGGGYDLSNNKGVELALSDIEKHIGLGEISCIHFNDSKKEVGSRVDRHEDIGFGKIGTSGLKSFVKAINNLSKRNIPLILETPAEHASYEAQITSIREW